MPSLHLHRLLPYALLLALAHLVWPGLASAQTVANRLALVVGNDAYQHVQPLQNARNDARLFAQTLRDARFDVTMVEDADRMSLWRAIDRFQLRIRKGDQVVFYFAGHGVQIGSDPVLLPVDIAAEHEAQVARDGVPIHQIQDALRDAGVALLVIDACRDNPFPPRGTRSIGQTRGLAPVEAAEGMAVILAAGRGQTALDRVPGEGVRHGLFTYALVDALRTPGLTVRQALMQARERVERVARAAGHQQRPALVDEMRGSFHFFPPVAAVPAAPPAATAPPRPWLVQTDAEIEQQAWDAALHANHVTAYEAYLREYPNGRFAPAARIQFAALTARAPSAAGPPPRSAPAAPSRPAATTPPVTAAAPARQAPATTTPGGAGAAGAVREAPVVMPPAAVAAAPSVASARPTGQAPMPGQAFVYRITDGFTGIAREAVFRVEHVEGGRVVFNDGTRVEDPQGRLLESRASIAGDLDLHEPPGGWAVDELMAGGGPTRLRYKNRDGDQVDLTGQRMGEEDVELPWGRTPAVHLRFIGHAQQFDGRLVIDRPARISVWVDPVSRRTLALSSVVTAQGSGWASSSRERAELVRRE